MGATSSVIGVNNVISNNYVQKSGSFKGHLNPTGG